ncbi:hypothetical protein D9M69_642230 [compost metagenome]
MDEIALAAVKVGFLFGNRSRNLDAFWIMRKYLRADPIFQRRHDAASVGIVFWVGRKHKLHVESKT